MGACIAKSETFDTLDAKLEKQKSKDGIQNSRGRHHSGEHGWSSFRTKRGMTTFTSENPLGKSALTKKHVVVLHKASPRSPAKMTEEEAGIKPKKMNKKKDLAKRKKDLNQQGPSGDGTTDPGPLVTTHSLNGSTSSQQKKKSTLRKMMSRSSMLSSTSRLSNYLSRRSTQRSSKMAQADRTLEHGSRRSDKTTIFEEEVGPIVKTENGKVVQVVQLL
jgi:hypothetical protein